jgi:hypothetical protein
MDTDSSIATTTLANALPVSRGNGGIGEAGHQMRMMHCRFLQWRLLNAKADAASKNKRAIAEVQLMGAWASISELRGKVARKRVQLDKENLKIKLTNVLSSQVVYLIRCSLTLSSFHCKYVIGYLQEYAPIDDEHIYR